MTTVTAPEWRATGYVTRPSPGSLAEVVDIILDKGLVIDVFARVSLLGLELLTIDARIVVASVDTYLRFAEAVGRLDLERRHPPRVSDLLEGAKPGGGGAAKGLAGVAKKAVGKAAQAVTGDEGDDEGRAGGGGRSGDQERGADGADNGG